MAKRVIRLTEGVTDYKEEVLMAALPRYGLEEAEMRRYVAVAGFFRRRRA